MFKSFCQRFFLPLNKVLVTLAACGRLFVPTFFRRTENKECVKTHDYEAPNNFEFLGRGEHTRVLTTKTWFWYTYKGSVRERCSVTLTACIVLVLLHKKSTRLGVLCMDICFVMRWLFAYRSYLLRVGSSATQSLRYHLQP